MRILNYSQIHITCVYCIYVFIFIYIYILSVLYNVLARTLCLIEKKSRKKKNGGYKSYEERNKKMVAWYEKKE